MSSPARPPSPADLAPGATGLRVLVVEDDPATLATTVEMLQALGHWSAGVATAEAAQARYFHGAFDVVMTDVGLPALSGLDLAAALHAEHPVRVLFATGEPRPAVVPAGTRWLQKPFGMDALTEALQALGASGREEKKSLSLDGPAMAPRA